VSTTPIAAAVNALAQLGRGIVAAMDRFEAPGSGVSVRARAAQEVADLMHERGEIMKACVDLFPEDMQELVTMLANGAEEAHRARAEQWGRIAMPLHASADRIAQQGAAVFADDGMAFVAGRGRVRR
jgi:hypothetical protein